MTLSAKKRAEKIIVMLDDCWRHLEQDRHNECVCLDKIVAQISEAIQEDREKTRQPLIVQLKRSREKGFRAAQEKAAEIAHGESFNWRNTDELRLAIADRIRNLKAND